MTIDSNGGGSSIIDKHQQVHVHAHQQHQSVSIATSNHHHHSNNNSGDHHGVNSILYPYQCQITDNNTLEEHASPIKYHANKEQSPSFYNSPFSYLLLNTPQQQQPSSSCTASSASRIKTNSTKKIVFNNYHGVENGGRSITRPYNNIKKQQPIIKMSSVTADEELPKRYICLVCGKKFVRPSSLTTHTYSHTGEKPHQCVQCGRRFSVISNLRKHGKVHVSSSLN